MLNCSHARIIYAEIFEKMLSGRLEVSFSIYVQCTSDFQSIIQVVHLAKQKV